MIIALANIGRSPTSKSLITGISIGGVGRLVVIKVKNLKHFLEISKQALCKKSPYSELFWCAFSRIRTEYGEIDAEYPSVFSPNAGKCGPD